MDLPLVTVGSFEQFNLPTDTALEQRLGLYQVFLKLYEQNRSLLDEILSLEGANGQLLSKATDAFVQAIVKDQQVIVMTNLLDGRTQSIQQPQNIWTIGRGRGMGLPVPDKRLSRCHAALQYVEAEGFYLVDLDSTNGSFVNGERVYSRVLLQDGDRIRLSSLTFHFFVCQHSHQSEAVAADILAQLQAAATVSQKSPLQNPENLPSSPREPGPEPEPEETFFFLR